MIPLRDVLPSRTTPWTTLAIIAVDTALFLHQRTLSETALRELIALYGFVPASFSALTLVTSMFLHASWVHFLGNMLYLWIFGDNVEDRVGHVRFLVFYLLCGAFAAGAQMLQDPASTVPMIGASGAVAGVLGAYFVLFPRSRVLTLVPLVFFVQIVEVPAVMFLALWFFFQLVSGLLDTFQTELGGPAAAGVAFWAHAGGFLAGLAGIFLFRRRDRLRVDWWDVAMRPR